MTVPRPLSHRAARIRAHLNRLRSEADGGIVVLFALSLVPILGAAGLGFEYTRAVMYRSRLASSADAAAMAAITTARTTIVENVQNQTDPTDDGIRAGLARAQLAFRANAGSQLDVTPVTPVVTLQRNGQTLTAKVDYSLSYPLMLGSLLGQSALAISGSSTSSLQLETYTDFYLLLDTSGSMGFPTSKEQQISFAKLNPDMNVLGVNNCAFACHFAGWRGYDLSKSNNIELRIATVGKAVQGLLDIAKARQKIANQFRVGLYPFVSFMETAADITTSIDSLYAKAAALDTYMDIGDSNTARGSGGTHYENLLPAISAKITRLGDGRTTTTPKAFVFLVTDGVANNQYWYNRTGWTGSQARLLDPKLCQPLKDRGVTISVLYTPYEPIALPFNPSVAVENVTVNALIPQVPQTLKDCASPGYFRSASTSAEITNALNAMFEQAVAVARLTQ